MNLDSVIGTFIAESRELLQQMEDALLQIEQSPEDPELINAIFRAAHTIKGSSGLFGFDSIVAFTHVAESVLDRVRAGELPFSADLSALMLLVGDHLAGLVNHLAEGRDLAELPEAMGIHEAELVQRLSQYLNSTPAATAETPSECATAPAMALPASTGTCPCASVPTACAMAWTRCPSCATSSPSATCCTSNRCSTTCPTSRPSIPKPATWAWKWPSPPKPTRR